MVDGGLATADLSSAVAVLPIGAVEAHGPHLPLGVDAMHNAHLLRALRRLPPEALVLALPPMDVGVSCEHSGFAGTLELSAETAAAAWTDIGACVARAGVKKLVLYNSHGGNHALAEVVARRLRHRHGMLCVLAMNLSQGMTPGTPCASLFPEEEVRYGIHGGALETSLMMHLTPELVSLDAARDFASKAQEIPKEAALQLHAPGFANKVGWLARPQPPRRRRQRRAPLRRRQGRGARRGVRGRPRRAPRGARRGRRRDARHRRLYPPQGDGAAP